MNLVKGQPETRLSHEDFRKKFLQSFFDPRFKELSDALDKVCDQAWKNYSDGRKAPVTEPAGEGFNDPHYPLSVEWKKTQEQVQIAQKGWSGSRPRILVINGSPRNEHTCPGEVSKSYLLSQMAMDLITLNSIDVELLDLSRATAEFGKNIYPCKGCVSTAMPLCHWPCSCYPNNSLGQVNDWMAEIYLSWVKAHGVLIITPVHWYQTPSVLKLMMDRMVCADGGNEDPTSTHGKDARRAKDIELAGWDFPLHLRDRTFAVIVHGDSVGAEAVRRNLCDWMTDLGLFAAGPRSALDGYIGYYEPYALSHSALEKDKKFTQECQNTVEALIQQVTLLKQGAKVSGQDLEQVRKK